MAALRKDPDAKILASLLFFLAIVFCPALLPASGSETGGAPPPPAETALAPGASFDDYARLIGGIAARQGGPLASYEKRPAWAEYAKYFDRSWAKLEERQLSPLREWVSKELAASASFDGTVFYPFSGPDFVNAFTCFPHARTYVLIALEPPGSVPDFRAMGDAQFDTYFAGMKRSLKDLLNIDYFISAHMKEQLQGAGIKGVLPVLLFSMAREKARVLDVRHWSMKPDGTIQESSALKPAYPDPAAVRGVRISFEAAGPGEGPPRTLYYFQFNLYSLDRQAGFKSFLKGLAPLAAFMKSASYVMFDPHVSGARQFVLEQSRYVLQEDSGIPLKYFDPALWTLRFFGVYTGPIQMFKHNYQEDLASVYRADKSLRPLPFGFGYHYETGAANLMLAERKYAQ